MASVEYPLEWGPQGDATGVEWWKATRYVSLPPLSSERIFVASMVAFALPQAKTVSVERIQNRGWWRDHQHMVSKLVDANIDPNERFLFHGTGQMQPKEALKHPDGLGKLSSIQTQFELRLLVVLSGVEHSHHWAPYVYFSDPNHIHMVQRQTLTTVHIVVIMYCRLDPRKSTAGGFYGCATYLAENPAYCIGGRYTHRKSGSDGWWLKQNVDCIFDWMCMSSVMWALYPYTVYFLILHFLPEPDLSVRP